MGKQFFFNILIFCAFVSQEIWTLSEENSQSSDNLIRKKRLIDHSPQTGIIRSIAQVPYFAVVLRNNNTECGSSILRRNILIAAASCFLYPGVYKVATGSHNRHFGNTFHDINVTEIHKDFEPHDLRNNLALLVILPFIDFEHTYLQPIPLHNEVLYGVNYGTFSGFGCIYADENWFIYPDELRQYTAYVLNPSVCRKIYAGIDNVINLEICLFDPYKRRGACHGDTGGGLVVDGQLLGVMSWTKVIPGRRSPDVFVNLSLAFYREWIDNFLRLHGR